MMNDDRPRPVSLEDLLRLKRAERPPAEFWAQFDRELRAKQLAALLEKRPWWRVAVPRLFAGLTRYHLPLGATAVLAITFLTVRGYRPSTPASARAEPFANAESSVPSMASVSLVATGLDTRATDNLVSAMPAHDNSSPAPVVDAGSSPVVATEIAHNDGPSRDVGPAPTVARFELSDEAISPTARTIKANLLAAHAAHPELARKFLGQARSYEARAASSRPQVVEPLAQMSLPSDVRRSRLLASALPASSVAPARIGERVSSRISQERLYDSISRYDVGGDRLSIKF